MEFRPFRVQLATRFRGVTERHGVLIRGRGPDGRDAWGEYSPFPDYTPERASRWWAAATEAARGEWPEPVRDTVPVNSIVPELPSGRAAQLAKAGGCTTAKVKVAGTMRIIDDARRVEAVAIALGPEGRVRVDANGAWDVDTAVKALRELDAAARAGGGPGLEYVEQPCMRVEDLAEVRRRTHVPVAADESVRIPGDADAVMRLGAADILVLKVAPMGGVQACLDVVDRYDVPVVVSSAMESSVGLLAGVALARALPELPYACGLGTSELLATDTVRKPIVPHDGVIGPVTLDVIV
ncbi:o-succinylbenzoate synthase [Demequina sp. SYSU T00068]|uniref:o-succinylbenzoate synthase n=1 Tax=Demequina lignilytica TaxID=3051663 RepID=UPI00262F82AE|nr:o-succinylbenzoate synthase [Demequina sp. SYSU T00068]MDN4489931.1 o-succinylbenzoate synthase [Demequina sp. SYSU T00068]